MKKTFLLLGVISTLFSSTRFLKKQPHLPDIIVTPLSQGNTVYKNIRELHFLGNQLNLNEKEIIKKYNLYKPLDQLYCYTKKDFCHNDSKNVIAFDFHDVIVHALYLERIKIFTKSFLKNMSLGFKVIFQRLKNILFKKNLPQGEYIITNHVLKNPQHIDALKAFTKLANQQKANPSVVALIKELKRKGYTVIMASNIGYFTLLDLLKNGNDDLKEVISLFDQIYFGHDSWRKPHKEFYEQIKKYYQNSKIIFVDDSEKNIKASKKYLTKYSFLYKGRYSAPDLRAYIADILC